MFKPDVNKIKMTSLFGEYDTSLLSSTYSIQNKDSGIRICSTLYFLILYNSVRDVFCVYYH